MRAAITGATGFIGSRLVQRLERPVVLSRDPGRAGQMLGSAVEAHLWDPSAGPAPLEALRGVDVVFNLAGDPVASGRWTDAKKQRIRQSRVLATRHLVEALAQLPEHQRPKVLVSASAVGYYGDRGDELLREDASPGADFLAEVCQAWERESQPLEKLGVRVVNPRIGIVLGHGGALAKMLLPFRLGLGGRLGSGRQWMPWIHLDDLVGLLLHAADRVVGPMNAASPNPVTNREFTAALAGVLHRPAIFPVPVLALKLAAGEFSEVLVSSQRAVPTVAEQSGYKFQYPELRPALENILTAG